MGWDDLFSFKLARTCHDCPLYCLSEGYLTKVYSEAREGVKAPASAPKPSHPESSWYQYPVVHPWARTHAAGVLVSHLEDGGKRLQDLFAFRMENITWSELDGGVSRDLLLHSHPQVTLWPSLSTAPSLMSTYLHVTEKRVADHSPEVGPGAEGWLSVQEAVVRWGCDRVPPIHVGRQWRQCRDTIHHSAQTLKQLVF
ncbi:uncharacterized protein LOC124993079 isoform X2 [Sciurus carolinensis]|uniref:uncharacterized protein LOC124993079 isoform X2 n=1 Tax=Sciurus carolinensis TaxID=30640 RepID=UPI001FB3CDA4|nr:uncharacterized protein LOC124993079 isoform X2 [Sciurus carolinensis]